MFCARLPSIFNTSHKMPRLPWNLHLVATWRSPDNTIRKKHATRHVWSAAPAMKTATHLLKTSHKTRCQTRLNVTKCHACHAKRSNATCETLSDPYGCGRLRTVADGCGRLGNVERTHPQPPDPQSGKGNPCYAFGKNMEKHNQRPRSREPNKPKKRTKTKSLSLHSALFWPHQLPNWRIKRGSNQLVELCRPRQEASPL